MNDIHVIIPVRPPEDGKRRLAPALGAAGRAALVERMFRHVLQVAVRCVGPERCHVVSRSPFLLELAAGAGAPLVTEVGHGLNAALEQAAATLPPGMAVLALSADLPLLEAADLAAMADALATAEVVIATDRARLGTNALLMRSPGLVRYAFGEHSLDRHRALAEAARVGVAVVDRPGLAFDVDHPADLAMLLDMPKTAHPRRADEAVSSRPI